MVDKTKGKLVLEIMYMVLVVVLCGLAPSLYWRKRGKPGDERSL